MRSEKFIKALKDLTINIVSMIIMNSNMHYMFRSMINGLLSRMIIGYWRWLDLNLILKKENGIFFGTVEDSEQHKPKATQINKLKNQNLKLLSSEWFYLTWRFMHALKIIYKTAY